MGGLEIEKGLVGNGKSYERKRIRKGFRKNLFTFLMAVILITSALALMPYDHMSSNTENGSEVKSVEHDFGAGYKNPQVVAALKSFVVGVYDNGYLNITIMSAADGSVLDGPIEITRDVYSYYAYRMAYDFTNDYLMILWINSSRALNFTFITGIGDGDPSRDANYILQNSVGNTGIGLASNDDGKFLAVWSDTSNHNHFSFVSEDGTYTTPQLVSNDDHSHASNFAAYDSNSGNYIILWRNYSGITGKYNITGKIIDSSGNTVVKDFLIADGVAAGTKYDYPTAEGGDGAFAVAYVNYNSPYDMHLVFYKAEDGAYISSVNLGNTARYGVSYIGIAYNGTGFTVVWTDSNYDVKSNTYTSDGTAAFSTPRTIAATSDSEEWQDVAYYPGNPNSYYFVWLDYTDNHVYGSYWTETEYVPELTAIIPIIAVLIAAIIFRRKESF